jgi:hypothetical protein
MSPACKPPPIRDRKTESAKPRYGEGFFSKLLDRIGAAIKSTSPSQIWARLNELSSLAVWISLIERSRLGEFSWPFSQVIGEIAKPLLAEQLMGGAIEPIIHVVAEGEGYQIVYEELRHA